ncbi:helix-turn-helix domain-containing protein [Paenibacillus sp. FSL K6-2859]|uniref:helix-turn-helix domain-containing protein n=1 Tax=Paenibacillus sp. FSL K6-2859 TaxID=2921482 RepID=UPI0030FA4B24
MYVVGECRLRTLLKERNMSQAELGRRTGYSRSQIGHWINDRDKVGVMGLDKARTIAKVLGLDSPYDLYAWTEVSAATPDKAASD